MRLFPSRLLVCVNIDACILHVCVASSRWSIGPLPDVGNVYIYMVPFIWTLIDEKEAR